MPEFTFDKEKMEMALAANGWKPFWNKDTWIPPMVDTPNFAGQDLKSAFITLCQQKNLL